MPTGCVAIRIKRKSRQDAAPTNQMHDLGAKYLMLLVRHGSGFQPRCVRSAFKPYRCLLNTGLYKIKM